MFQSLPARRLIIRSRVNRENLGHPGVFAMIFIRSWVLTFAFAMEMLLILVSGRLQAMDPRAV